MDLADLAVLASQWLTEGTMEIEDIVWVQINDPGITDHEPFNGQMSRHETTNAQYCQFLNAALASGDITVSDSLVYGAEGSNSGADFVTEKYYNLAGTGYDQNGAIDGGAARINYTGSTFVVDSGFENHPVTWVSWYGATAFCNYYGWRLPTEWEWQAVADYDGTFLYGCGPSISNNIANYENSDHPDGTTAVGTFGMYGYGMCDMAGNVWEWTSSMDDNISWDPWPAHCGGGWSHSDSWCLVAPGYHGFRDAMIGDIGFRVCR